MSFSATAPLFIHVSGQELLFFTKHLSTMIKAGIPLEEALQILYEQTDSGSLRYVAKDVHTQVLNGQKFSTALAAHPKVFDSLYCQLIAVSETAGTLEENLNFLAVQLGKSQALQKKIKGALLYPTVVFVATFGMGGFISFYILPQLVGFFDSFETTLPLSTRILLAFANLMKDHGLALLFAAALMVVLFQLAIRTPLVKPHWHSLMLRLPVFGKLIRYGQLARFSRNLGMLLASGVPITKSLETTAATLNNYGYQHQLVDAAARLQKGTQLGVVLSEKNTLEYPLLVSRMIAVGERTGKLDETLLYLADFYEEEIDSLSKNLSTLLEPLLLLTVGVVVGFVAIAIISPIYELTGSLRR
jgi:type IV pilus assembly protein PilC